MRFTIEQRFQTAPGDVARAYADPALYATLPETDKLARPEVVHHGAEGDRVVLEVRYRFKGDLSSAVRAILDPAKLTWIERTIHDLAGLTVAFELLPDHYPDRLRAAGHVRVEAGPDGRGSRRRGEGELKVKAPLVAGTVERTLVADLQRHLAAEPQAVDAFVAGG